MTGKALKTNIEQKFERVQDLIGNTPMYVINFKFRGEKRTTKSHSLNPNVAPQE